MNKKIIIICSMVLIFIIGIIIYCLYLFNYIPHKMYTNEYFGIDNYYSSIDYDNDGIDDQSDILKALKNILVLNLYIKVNIIVAVILMIIMEYV